MKLTIIVPEIEYEIDLVEESDDDIVIEHNLTIAGEVIMEENGCSMNMISEDERMFLADCLRDGMFEYIKHKIQKT